MNVKYKKTDKFFFVYTIENIKTNEISVYRGGSSLFPVFVTLKIPPRMEKDRKNLITKLIKSYETPEEADKFYELLKNKIK